VIFYAGHGGTRTHQLGTQVIKTGYLIPADASDKTATWVELDAWLRAVSLLPAKHILVVLDACHGGIALSSIIKWRDTDTWKDAPLSILKERRSRRIITSALDDQMALDSGPIPGHSLFTGCLIEALSNRLSQGSSRMVTGSELGLYVQRRVETYPGSRQTPDFGTFDFDDRGEMVIGLADEPSSHTEPINESSLTLATSTSKPVVELASDRRPRIRRSLVIVGSAFSVLIAIALVRYFAINDVANPPVDRPPHSGSDANTSGSTDAQQAFVGDDPFGHTLRRYIAEAQSGFVALGAREDGDWAPTVSFPGAVRCDGSRLSDNNFIECVLYSSRERAVADAKFAEIVAHVQAIVPEWKTDDLTQSNFPRLIFSYGDPMKVTVDVAVLHHGDDYDVFLAVQRWSRY
jgi:hypothetical protein